MRLSARTSRFAALLGLASICLSGCGGQGGVPIGTGSNPTSTPVSVTIAWPARTRTINAPSSAESCMVTLANANPSGGDFTFEIDRGSNLSAFTQTYRSTSSALYGATTATVNFYADVLASGAVVATATQPVTLNSDGTGLSSIVVGFTIQAVSVWANQSVTVGSTSQLIFTAYNSTASNAKVVAITPGSATWKVTSGSNLTLTPDGIATGLSVGTPSVTATVDGVTSPSTVVNVVGP